MTAKQQLPASPGPIGVFDSGYGGLTILRHLRSQMPQYDYLYLGDNARAPYGTRSFEVVNEFTLEAVTKLFELGCHLVILACNTASAKALRNIQQRHLPTLDPDRRVLGIIRPTAEVVGQLTRTGHVGILATEGTVKSRTYELEIAKLWPQLTVASVACPMFVPLVEAGEQDSPGADYFVRRYLEDLRQADPQVDTLILGCTHYPLLQRKIEQHAPQGLTVVPQGQHVANSLVTYLQRHHEIDARLTKGATVSYLTTEQPDQFARNASIFLSTPITAARIVLG